jgi:hypothetical protein
MSITSMSAAAASAISLFTSASSWSAANAASMMAGSLVTAGMAGGAITSNGLRGVMSLAWRGLASSG